MPLNFATRSGCTPISYMASTMRSEMALWPQPAHRVVFPPLYSITLRPMRLVFGPPGVDSIVGVVAIYLPSIMLNSSVTERASSGNPSRWLMLRKRSI